jgi:dTDP-4-dehydrorhamnose reductase
VDKLNILITGGTGLLGKALVYLGRDRFQLSAIHVGRAVRVVGVRYFETDIRDRESVSSAIRMVDPDVIIHTAAMTDVDLCEREKGLACEINCRGTQNVVEAAEVTEAKLVYISTDFVFDGTRGDYKEDDLPHPINYYGKTKLLGENMIGARENSLIIRTSFYGLNPLGDKKGLEGIIEKAAAGEKILAPTDIFNSMVSVDTVSQITYELIRRGATGLYHVGHRGKMSRYEFLGNLFAVLDRPVDNLVPIDYQEYSKGKDARRPRDASLNVQKIQDDFDLSSPLVKEDLARLVKHSREYFSFFGSSQSWN